MAHIPPSAPNLGAGIVCLPSNWVFACLTGHTEDAQITFHPLGEDAKSDRRLKSNCHKCYQALAGSICSQGCGWKELLKVARVLLFPGLICSVENQSPRILLSCG